MAKQKESLNIQIGGVELREINGPRINRIAPTQAVDAAAVNHNINPPNPKNSTCNFFFKILFFAHLLALTLLVSFLSIRGFLAKTPAFHPLRYFLPLLSSISLSALVTLLWLLFTLHRPKKSLDASLWLSPLLTCLAAALLLVYSTGASFAFGVPSLIVGVSQSLYACWINPRIPYACRILSVSISIVKFSVVVGKYVGLAVLAGVLYSWIWILGVGGLAAAEDRRFDTIYVLLLLLSLAWTMQVIRNSVHVALSHIAYQAAHNTAGITAHDAVHGTCSRALGDICIGSAISPTVCLIRGTARAIDLLAGDTDEFLFSCAGCYLGVADRLATHANRWGFVSVGAHGKGFVEASEDTWRMFIRRGMCPVIDSDLTGAFCFFCGAAGGSFAALVCGSWMLAVDEEFATGATLYAFIIGYFMVRIGMAWPQACVSACYVVYAEDPHNGLLGSVVADRIRELDPSLD